MERMAWTAERLEERFNGIDRRFDEVDRRFDHVDHRFAEVDRRFNDVDRRFDRLEGEMVGLRITLNRVGGGIIVGLVGVIAAIFLNGAT
jgi:tetrahydromethanopterin S-methyltransferase subunit G